MIKMKEAPGFLRKWFNAMDDDELKEVYGRLSLHDDLVKTLRETNAKLNRAGIRHAHAERVLKKVGTE